MSIKGRLPIPNGNEVADDSLGSAVRSAPIRYSAGGFASLDSWSSSSPARDSLSPTANGDNVSNELNSEYPNRSAALSRSTLSSSDERSSRIQSEGASSQTRLNFGPTTSNPFFPLSRQMVESSAAELGWPSSQPSTHSSSLLSTTSLNVNNPSSLPQKIQFPWPDFHPDSTISKRPSNSSKPMNNEPDSVSEEVVDSATLSHSIDRSQLVEGMSSKMLWGMDPNNDNSLLLDNANSWSGGDYFSTFPRLSPQGPKDHQHFDSWSAAHSASVQASKFLADDLGSRSSQTQNASAEIRRSQMDLNSTPIHSSFPSFPHDTSSFDTSKIFYGGDSRDGNSGDSFRNVFGVNADMACQIMTSVPADGMNLFSVWSADSNPPIVPTTSDLPCSWSPSTLAIANSSSFIASDVPMRNFSGHRSFAERMSSASVEAPIWNSSFQTGNKIELPPTFRSASITYEPRGQFGSGRGTALDQSESYPHFHTSYSGFISTEPSSFDSVSFQSTFPRNLAGSFTAHSLNDTRMGNEKADLLRSISGGARPGEGLKTSIYSEFSPGKNYESFNSTGMLQDRMQEYDDAEDDGQDASIQQRPTKRRKIRSQTNRPSTSFSADHGKMSSPDGDTSSLNGDSSRDSARPGKPHRYERFSAGEKAYLELIYSQGVCNPFKKERLEIVKVLGGTTTERRLKNWFENRRRRDRGDGDSESPENESSG